MSHDLYFPPEWQISRMVQLTWPHSQTDWSDNLEAVTATFVNIARHILESCKLLIVAPDISLVKNQLQSSKVNLSNIQFFQIDTNDTWARDHGGLTIFKDGEALVYDFRFNGWGLKFPANLDNLITSQLNESHILYNQYKNMQHFVLEGGSIEVDGNGTLMTTSECLLSPNRNPHLCQEDIENQLIEYFGVSQILWLESGYLCGDDTDSHIDTLARFCPNNTIAYVQCLDEYDEHYTALYEMEQELIAFRNVHNQPYHLIPLPMADAIYNIDNERLPATYANFLVVNDRVLVPTYGSKKDNIALNRIAEAFPTYEIYGIDCCELIKQHGSLHCVTMQYPEEL